jgi:hypothetical protein
MTEMGHSRPNWTVRAMSAFLPLATELRTSLEVRFVPIVVDRESIACETPLANPAHVAAENAED